MYQPAKKGTHCFIKHPFSYPWLQMVLLGIGQPKKYIGLMQMSEMLRFWIQTAETVKSFLEMSQGASQEPSSLTQPQGKLSYY